ncbi:alpha/beta fold hydrolase [Paenibacillus flagellatus]|uniref:Alpha/beta hydrolase n=1 Tax=Paenibacillus flagellatus TaxID=2211139 RepID=A0A2V5K539_9BACL|nr:alpha/beta hydrolase [Paenibacillus flagellatus]PYI53852.1 alpha/beta hydrolase [Paenibacillus flagellatus]
MPIATINGTLLNYHVHGKGTPIVFIHPPLLTSANFRYQQVQLAGEFSVVTFDIRGHGKSGPSKAPITYELIVEDIVRLLDYLGIPKAFVCGYSTGGSVALEAMLTHPDRFLGGILISAMSEASDFVLKNRIRLAIGLSRWKTMLAPLMWAITWGNADGRLTFRNLFRDARRGHAENIHQYYKYSLGYSCTKRLSDVRAPVLLLYGTKDRGFKRYRKLLERELPDCEVHLCKDEKHQIPTKAASEMNDVIRRWIRGLLRDRRLALDEPTRDEPAEAAFAPDGAGEPLGVPPEERRT